jgi:hypothetical protein
MEKLILKFKGFWSFLNKSKSWNIKHENTMKMLQDIFGAKETQTILDGKNTRHLVIDAVEVDRPPVRKEKMKEVPFA